MRQQQPIRLTRRGRVVLFTFLLGVAGGIASLAAAPGQAADPPGPAPTVIVQPGDTLWGIATRHSGQDRRRRMIWPSSASRESTTRESACRQYGHRMSHSRICRDYPDKWAQQRRLGAPERPSPR